jgi:hypothetical protein
VAERVPYYGVHDRRGDHAGRPGAVLPATGASALYASLRRPALR